MGWHINRGKDQLAEFHPAARFRKELYRPDVIKLLLKTATASNWHWPRPTRPAARKARRSPTSKSCCRPRSASPRRNRTRSRRPRSASPRRPRARQAPGHRVAPGARWPATARRGKRCASSTNRDSARCVARGQSPYRPANTACKSWPTVVSARGRPTKSSSVTRGKNQGQRQPRLIVLAVGVSKYANANVGKLDYAATDAKAVAAAFEKSGKGLYHEAKIKLLADEDATRDKVMDGLDWLLKETSQDDYAVVFFAGHGETDNVGNVYFLPVDADKEKLRSNGSGRGGTHEGIPRPAAEQTRANSGCLPCGSGEHRGNKRSGGSVTDNLVRDLLTPENGVVVMCSSTGREFSLESNEHRMGAFTVRDGGPHWQGSKGQRRAGVYTSSAQLRVRPGEGTDQGPATSRDEESR